MYACRVSTCIELTLGTTEATWPRKRRWQRRQRRQPRRKRSNRSAKISWHPDSVCSVTPVAAWTGGSFRQQYIRATNSQAGPLSRWLLPDGPGFRCANRPSPRILPPIQCTNPLMTSKGQPQQDILREDMGGLPSITTLRHRDDTYDAATKARYHAFLSKKLNEPATTKSDEEKDPAAADAFYARDGAWLRENPRRKRANTSPRQRRAPEARAPAPLL
jgi:hypothetical protein